MTNSEHSINLPEDLEAAETPTEIGEMLEDVDSALEVAKNGSEKRIRNAENERVRISYLKTVSTLLRTKRKLLRDRSLSELSERYDQLEAELEAER